MRERERARDIKLSIYLSIYISILFISTCICMRSTPGGPMTDAEAASFLKDPHAQDILKVRGWEEEGKKLGKQNKQIKNCNGTNVKDTFLLDGILVHSKSGDTFLQKSIPHIRERLP